MTEPTEEEQVNQDGVVDQVSHDENSVQVPDSAKPKVIKKVTRKKVVGISFSEFMRRIMRHDNIEYTPVVPKERLENHPRRPPGFISPGFTRAFSTYNMVAVLLPEICSEYVLITGIKGREKIEIIPNPHQ